MKNLLQDFFLQAPVPMCILTGKEHFFSLVNPPYIRLVGGKDPTGQKLLDFFDVDMSVFKKLLDDVYETGNSFVGKEVPARLTDEHGGLKDYWLDIGYYPYRSEKGEIVGVLVIATDVTDQYLSRKQIEDSHHVFQELANSMPQHVWRASPDGMLDYFNEIWFQYSGSSYADNSGLGWTRFVHSEDIAHASEQWAQSLKTGQDYTVEFRLLRHDGTFRWFIARAQPIYDDQKRITKWIGTNTDIHDMKAVADQIRLETLKFETLFADSATSLSLLKGEDLIFEKVNPSYHQLFNNRVKVGVPILEVLPEIKDQPFGNLLKAVFKSGMPYRESEAQAFLRRTDESPLEERYFDQTYTQVLDAHGKPYGVFIHAIEITEAVMARKKLANLAHELGVAVNTRDEFLSVASHELKTPLTSMKLQTQSMRRQHEKLGMAAFDSPKLVKMLDNNEKQISRLVRLVDDMLDIARIHSGKLSFQMEECDLKDIILDVYSLLKEQLDNAGCTATIDLDENCIGLFDRSRIEQVIINLLTNVLRYGKGKPLRMMLKNFGDHVVIKIKDHGIGIAEENITKVFNRFERIQMSGERSGLGMGLYITREIVLAHGGRIWLESEMDQGTTFSIELPIKK